MEQTEQLLSPANVSKTRDAVLSSHHLDGNFYTSLEIQDLEKEKIFLKEWLFVGREEQFPNPGDYLATRIVGEPVVIVRDEGGNLNVYANVCRHRGVEVAKLGNGNATSFMCPYHAWTYGLDGKLISAPGMTESSFDPGACRLPTLKSEIWRGCVFVTFNPNPEPFSEVIAELDVQMEFAHLERCRVAKHYVIDLQCNWKFAHENTFDFYHVNTIHWESFGKFYKTQPDPDTFAHWSNGGFSFKWEAAPLTKDGTSSIGTMPWFEDQPGAAFYGHQFPNLIMAGRSDAVTLLSTWPISPERCQINVHTLVAEEAFEKPDFTDWSTDQEKSFREVMDEDREMVESLQNGAGSRMFHPGGMAKMEAFIHHYLNAYLDRMQNSDG